jgi:hypothetical protein
MFDALLRARDEYLTQQKKVDEYENFARSVQKLKKDLEAMGIKPSREKLYGRPYKA